MVNFYYRFCSTIHYFFDKKIKIKDPSIFSLLFISLLQGIYLFGCYYSFSLINKHKLYLNKWYLYLGFILIIFLNYLIVYRKGKQYEYYNMLLNRYLVIGAIIGGYIFMGVSGQLYKDFFYDK